MHVNISCEAINYFVVDYIILLIVLIVFFGKCHSRITPSRCTDEGKTATSEENTGDESSHTHTSVNSLARKSYDVFMNQLVSFAEEADTGGERCFVCLCSKLFSYLSLVNL